MTTLKSLIMVSALLLGGTSLGMAQNGPPTGGQPPVAGGAAVNPAASTSAWSARRHHGTRHHRMYMMTVDRTHKGSKLTPAKNVEPQIKQ